MPEPKSLIDHVSIIEQKLLNEIKLNEAREEHVRNRLQRLEQVLFGEEEPMALVAGKAPDGAGPPGLPSESEMTAVSTLLDQLREIHKLAADLRTQVTTFPDEVAMAPRQRTGKMPRSRKPAPKDPLVSPSSRGRSRR